MRARISSSSGSAVAKKNLRRAAMLEAIAIARALLPLRHPPVISVNTEFEY
jgi:hypothetical protein